MPKRLELNFKTGVWYLWLKEGSDEKLAGTPYKDFVETYDCGKDPTKKDADKTVNTGLVVYIPDEFIDQAAEKFPADLIESVGFGRFEQPGLKPIIENENGLRLLVYKSGGDNQFTVDAGGPTIESVLNNLKEHELHA
jgi:hypothetical protein